MPAWTTPDPSTPATPPYGGTFRRGRTFAARVPTFPVFLRLGGRPCVVFGGSGGFVDEKVRGLLDAGAEVTLIWLGTDAETVAGLRRDAGGRFVHLQRRFRAGDLDRAFVAVAERDAPLLDDIESAAAHRQVPLNVVDDPRRCSYILPSVVRRGDLAVAVSTAGAAPALAVRLRQQLERQLGAHHARFLELAAGLRRGLASRLPSFGQRRDLWYRLVDSDVLELLAKGDEDAATARIAEITGLLPEVVS